MPRSVLDFRGDSILAAVSLLRRETSNKRGTKNKRLNYALDPTYLLKVLHTAQF